MKVKITREDLKEVVDENGNIRTEIDKAKLQRRIDDLKKAFRDPQTKREALSTIGVKILELASKNAGFYYDNAGARFYGTERDKFQPLAESTKTAYEQRGLMPHLGLNLGHNKILQALMIGGEGNIFNVTSNTLTVGFNSELAFLHEFGGLRLPGKHIINMGVPDDANIWIPPRPFLLPAFRHVRDSWDWDIQSDPYISPSIFAGYFDLVRESLRSLNIEMEI